MTASTTLPARPPTTRPQRGTLTGHRRTTLGRSPFAATMPATVTAALFGLASLAWLFAADHLPGGRWLVVHLFTLGVLTTLICAYTRHFAARLTGGSDPLSSGAAAWLGAGALTVFVVLMLVGRAQGTHLPLAVGTVGIMAAVTVNLLLLRRLRRRAVNDRFSWVVRRYEHAHLAFLAAGALGGALGAGWVPGTWYGGVRDAHIHLAVLGWAGLTVLATLVVFGPALLRTRMEPGAADAASSALRHATAGLGVAAAALVASAATGGALPLALLTAGGLLVYARGVVVVAAPLVRAAWRHDRSPLRWSIAAVLVWFPITVGLAALVAATDATAWRELPGIILLVGVLAQLILTVVLYVGPMLRGRDLAARDRLLARVERLAGPVAVSLNAGVLLVVGATTATRLGVGTGWMSGFGWALVAVAVLGGLATLAAPLGAVDPTRVRSRTAARYRTTQDQSPAARSS